MRLRAVLTMFALAIFLPGCGTGDGLDRQAISGNVTSNGSPLTQGIIRFEPTGETGTLAEADITSGTCVIDREAGLVPGEYRVLIFSPETSRRTPVGTRPSDQPPHIRNSTTPITMHNVAANCGNLGYDTPNTPIKDAITNNDRCNPTNTSNPPGDNS